VEVLERKELVDFNELGFRFLNLDFVGEIYNSSSLSESLVEHAVNQLINFMKGNVSPPRIIMLQSTTISVVVTNTCDVSLETPSKCSTKANAMAPLSPLNHITTWFFFGNLDVTEII